MTERSFAFVALFGAPNVGKSTLVNRLVGSKVSIATPKAQTTRTRVMGLVIHEASQLALIDTPGVFRAKTKLDRGMVASAHAARDTADIVLTIVDVHRPPESPPSRTHADVLQICLINKIDMVKPAQLLPIIDSLAKSEAVDEIMPISAKTGEGCDRLLEFLANAAPKGVWHFPADQLSDMNDTLFCAEITREQIFLQMQQELPYDICVATDSFTQNANEVAIYQTILVARESQKCIVIGKGAKRLKAINTAARHNMEKLLGYRVHLFTTVKTDGKWKKDPGYYHMWNLPTL